MHASRLSRRCFLGRSAAAAAACAVPSIVTSRTRAVAAGAAKPLRVLQIGCGRIAHEMDMPGILRHPQLARIVGVCDVDSKRAGLAKDRVRAAYRKSLGEAPEILASGSYRELLERDDIDAVSISTPDHWHAQPVVEAALAGKHIYVQKPLTLTIAEGQVVARVVRDKQRILQIGSQQRSTEQFHRACQLVRNGAIGKVLRIQIGLPTDPAGGDGKVIPVPDTFDYDQWLGWTKEVPYTKDRCHSQAGFKERPGWLRLNQFTCGMMTGWGSHHIDIAHWGMDTEMTGPVAIDAKAQWPGPDSFWDVHGTYDVKLRYANGVEMHISDKHTNGVRFEGEKGWVFVSRGGFSATASDPSSGSKAGKALDASDTSWLSADLSKHDIQLHRSPQWDHHLDWLTAIAGNHDPTTNVETGHRSNSACMVSWIGMKLGRPLKWDPVHERFDDDEANAMIHREERGSYGAVQLAKKLNI